MNSVESAASLFGSEDAGPDPFATLGSAETDTATNDENEHTLTASEKHGADQLAANLFGSDSVPSDVQHTPWSSEPTSQDSYTYGASAYSQDQSAGTSYTEQQAQGWYDNHGQWQNNQYLPVDTCEHHFYLYQPNFQARQCSPNIYHKPKSQCPFHSI